ncbi:MAG: transposase [Planctomycetales bacterium]|nr:transposase [Planctomycetales bacterium]
MPRTKRADEAGCIYHAINRGNAKQEIFHKPEDYDAFLRTLREGLDKYPVDLLSFCLMPNHWHLVVRPQKDGMMGNMLGWVSATHTLRYHAHYQNQGGGHVYQGPFKSFPVADDSHFLTVCRYVERNALSGGLVDRAEDWKYGSLYRWHFKQDIEPPLLTNWPIRRLSGWTDRVNEPLSESDLEKIRTCVKRGRPFGDEEWVERTCERTGLWSTVRPLGRPRKKRKVQAVKR